ncbi:FG-GAP repeat protein [Caulifigura coniformis]|uniref:FG-GAP repeat protein n=1 Tax=Caulifigura coniformis TaxID=2527983 RepID=A0A517SJ05_9PLAN|nr:FG-GAP-like repeat-containing protein [Caulifigura coniformis]QDT56118.1 FG-GAP repeat protein [Caulifigura coniformis]
MPTTRPLSRAWKSLWKKSRATRALANRWQTAEPLEVRVLPAAVTITASVDGYARDANRDGVFTVLDDTSETLLTRLSTSATIGAERAMFEFDLTATSTALSVSSATFIVNVSQVGKNGAVLPKINLFGYSGDGTLTLDDASAIGTAVSSATISTTGELRLELDLDYVRSKFGSYLGLRIENAVLNGPFAVYTSQESAFTAPKLELDINDTSFNIDERRPKGTIVGRIGIGTNSNYTITGGDPGNVFALNPTTGVITVLDSSLLTYANQQKYVLNVQAVLADGSFGTFNVTINVKNVFGGNNQPVVTASEFELTEFSPVNTVVGRVEASDPDSADPLTYSIAAGNTGNAFKIDSRTGVISVNDQNALSYIASPSFVLYVGVRDTRSPAGTQPVLQKVQIFLTPRSTPINSSNFVRITPGSDAEARDVNNDGTFESVDAPANVMFIRPGEPGVVGRRPVMEFDLSGVSSGKVVKSAYLTIYVSAYGGSNHPVSVYGYAGDGIVTAGDAVLGTLIGSKTITINSKADLRAYTIELNPALIQQLIGTQSDLGLVLRNDLNLNVLGIDSVEGPVNLGNPLSRQPSLNLVLEDPSDDVVFQDNSTGALTVARSDGSTFVNQPAAVLRPGVTFSELLTGDFNGDGRLDIAGRNAANGQVLVALASGNQFVTSATAWTTLPFASTMRDLFVGDFNGDGKDDIVGRNAQGQLQVAQSNGTKFTNVVYETLPADLRALTNVKVGDFNGDGRDDLVGFNTSTGQVIASISNGSTFTSSVWGNVPLNVAVTEVNVGDFNGDGRDDVFFRQGTLNLVVLRSTGTAFSSMAFGMLKAGVPYIGFRMGDFNGDGLEDIVGFTGTGAMTLFRSTGSSFTQHGGGILPVPAVGIDPKDIVIGDFNRDGKSDILVRKAVSTTIGKVTTTTQNLYVAQGTDLNVDTFTSSLFGTIEGTGPFSLIGVGNF